MLKNHNHDLVQQLSETSDSIWRMDMYLKSAEGCGSCVKIWKQLKKDYEKHIELLREEIGRHVKEGRFD